MEPRRPQNEEEIYLAGPISNDPVFNLADSARIARRLRDKGHKVIDAAAIRHAGYVGQAPGYDWHDYMDEDIPYLMGCTAICLRPEWPYSRGALAELTIAATIGINVYYYDNETDAMILMGAR